jgi:hypothetical protein
VLTDDLVPGGEWNQMCEPGGINHVAIVHELINSFSE